MANENLDRFIEAQQRDYTIALSEIKQGRKRNHWMWYIFPQVQGLGFSQTSRYYAINDLEEAAQYLDHPILGRHLVEISNMLLKIRETSAAKIFGSPDDLKLRSSMTLFAAVPNADPVFRSVLDKFFEGKPDPQTLSAIKEA